MNSTLLQELAEAARGTLALLMGRRDAAKYFDLGMRGLAGSFVAFLVAAVFNAYLPGFVGQDAEVAQEATTALAPSLALFMVGVLFVLQTAFGAMALRQFDRLDGLVPYLVADNWATFFVTGLSAILMFLNVSAEVAILMVGGVVIVSEINIARLIVTLKPMQIAMFLIAQLVGVLSGLMLLSGLFPDALGS